MPTSSDIFPRRLTEIDDLTRSDHSWLAGGDRCLFLGEYTARKGFSFSATNQVVMNFKKSVVRRGLSDWPHKERAIRDVGAAFGAAIAAEWLGCATLVPIPPSKAKDDPLHDDRMVRMLQCIPSACPLDIRELIVQNGSMTPAHDAVIRPRPDEIAAAYQIDEALAYPPPATLAIFDDVMTTGAHFVAAKRSLAARFPQAAIYGFFIARRVPETTDYSVFLDDPNPAH